MREAELLGAMRAAPGDEGPIHVYADWLLSRGDPRGELIMLDQRERAGAAMTLAELDRLLELASEHGFPWLPDDPCAGIFRFDGGGAMPTQYFLEHGGHHYYLRDRYGFSIHVDHVTVFEGRLATRSSGEWTFCETNVILAIVSAAITSGQPLSELELPDDLEAHPRFHPGRSPLYSFPHGLYPSGRTLELRDVPRWYQLWDRRQRLVGVEPRPRTQQCCGCGVEGLRCDVQDCEAKPVSSTRRPPARTRA